MIILDFNGLPGCGKSTYAKEVYDRLRSENVKCEFFNDNEYLETAQRNKKKIKFYIRILRFKNLIYAFKLLFKFRYKEKDFKRRIKLKDRIWKWIRIIILIDKIHFINKKEDIDVLIIDQGIVQDFTDYVLDKCISEEKISSYSNKYMKLNKKIILVNLEIEEAISINRIKKRNRKKYDVDKMEIHELEIFLKQYSEKLKNVRKVFAKNFVNINLDVNKEENLYYNVNKIIKLIKESSEIRW